MKKNDVDANIHITVSLPGKEPIDFNFSVPNALNAIPRTKQNILVIQKALMDGLSKEWGQIIRVKL